MDTRYIVNHIKNEEQVHEHDDDDEHCTSPRYISATYQPESYAALNQKYLRRHYDEMISSPFSGPGHQVLLNDDGCFLKPLLAHHLHHHHQPHHHHHYHLHLQQQQQQQQQLLFRHQPYNTIPLPPPSFDPSDVCPADIPQHLLLVQEPKFPPQTFDIPDIQDSNSVFGGGGGGDALDPATFGGYSVSVSASSSAQPRSPHLLLLQSYDGGGGSSAFYGSPPPTTTMIPPDRHSPRGSAVLPPPPPPTAYPAWQQQPSRVLSSTGSTDSSPGSQVEESTTTAAENPSTLQQPQQVQPSAKSNGMTSSLSSISRLPKKKARSPKRRKRKDPNEPQKPVSAYSLFFRNAQAAIKSQNPGATFGDVSKIVASMWDGLDDDVKNFYKQQMEAAKKEYLKQLAVYRAALVSKDAQEKTETADTEAGINTHQAPPPPPPTTPPVQAPPSSQKADDGNGSSPSSPIPAPLCVQSMHGFQTHQPLSPTAEPVSHHHHHLHHHQQQQQHHYHRHMMSPSAVRHPPIFYQDGSPCLRISYTLSSDGSSSASSSASSLAAMRSSFLTYGQKMDHDAVVQRIPEPGPYFVGMGSDAEYKSGEFITASLGNGFVNGLCREISCRSFVESDEGDDQKLT